MLKLVLENVTFTSRAAEAPRVFATESAHAAALMKDRVFTLLGSMDESGAFSNGNFLSRNQKMVLCQYVSVVDQKLAETDLEPEAGLLSKIAMITKHIDLSGAPRSPAELAGRGALMLVIMGRSIMIYQIFSPFEELMLDSSFAKMYHYALESINDNSRDACDMLDYIEYTPKLFGYNEPSSQIVELEQLVSDDRDALARAWAITRHFGMEV